VTAGLASAARAAPRRLCGRLVLAVAFAAAPIPLTAQQPTPREIVAHADAIRFPQTAYEVNVTVTSATGGRQESRKYRILSKGNDRTLVITVEPASERGQVLLMKDRDLWLYMPSLSQPLRLPLSQRLTGQVANGDLARANFANDYNATVLRTEEVEGSPHLVLELLAADRGLTYNRLLYWVESKTFNPYKAEFYGLSGKLLKTCRYENFVNAGGARRPSRVRMEDALTGGGASILDYGGFRIKDIPDKFFSKDYLKKL
jgi:outer membrane lipoprotein-sorting protein